MPFASINGQSIFFEDTGGTGFPVVMMHGFLMDHSLFDPQVKALAPDYRCIRFDARAFGQTRWDGKAFTLYDTASDCVGLMDHLGIQHAVIVGMSQGGYAALRFALKYPERAKAFVLMSTWAGVDDAPTKALFAQMRDTWAAAGPIDPLLQGLATVLLGAADTPEMARHWKTWMAKWKTYSKEAIVHAMNNLLERDDLSARICEISHPALVTHGAADQGMPIALGEQLSTQLSNCQGFVAAPGAAHAANFTHPNAINPAFLDFLKRATN